MADVVPLRPVVAAPAAPDSPSPPPPRTDTPSAPPAPPAPPHHRPAPPLTPGAVAGLDRRTADRLRRGQLPIEARLDLHGMTQHQAHTALRQFIVSSSLAGRRCVLVITGKGSRSPRTAHEARSVLRHRVPQWLNDDFRTQVVAVTHARPQDGGEGALYVLLRRQRGGR